MPLRNRGPILLNGPFRSSPPSGTKKEPRCNCDECRNKRIERRIARAVARLEKEAQSEFLEPPGYEDVLPSYREVTPLPATAEVFNQVDEYPDYLESPELHYEHFLNSGNRTKKRSQAVVDNEDEEVLELPTYPWD